MDRYRTKYKKNIVLEENIRIILKDKNIKNYNNIDNKKFKDKIFNIDSKRSNNDRRSKIKTLNINNVNVIIFKVS